MLEQFSKTTTVEIERLAKSLTPENEKDIFTQLLQIIHRKKYSVRTTLVRYSVMRQYMKLFTKNKTLLDTFIPPKEMSDKITAENIHRRDKRQVVQVSRKLIENILQLEDSRNMYDMCLYLLFVTGRRTREMTHSRYYNKAHHARMFIDGVLKRSDEGIGCSFPTMVSKTKTLRKIRQFKKMLLRNPMKPKNFSSNLLSRMHKVVSPYSNPHQLRAIYANYMYKFRNTDSLKINTFIMDVLCHESVTTSLSYTGYKLIFETDFVE
jgi:hypothetical protein